jgi:hypothetical protein
MKKTVIGILTFITGLALIISCKQHKPLNKTTNMTTTNLHSSEIYFADGGIWVSLGLLPANSKAATRQDVNNLGGSVGLLVQSPSDASTDEIPAGDLETTKAYAQRIAKMTKQFKG